MIPLSCSNCWFNGLQYGSFGSTLGYCTEHRVVLRRADETTCRRHVRKDLSIGAALDEHTFHRDQFEDRVMPLHGWNGAASDLYETEQGDLLGHDVVGSVVREYGDLGTKIESLAQLRRIPGARSELALLSLGRAYVRRCVANEGRWTSGLHLAWWVRERLDKEPEVLGDALRYSLPIPIERQIELVRWALVMFRLTFLSDIGSHAALEGHGVARLSSLAEDAAEDTASTSFSKLFRWVRRKAVKRFDEVLPYAAYRQLASELHQDRAQSE